MQYFFRISSIFIYYAEILCKHIYVNFVTDDLVLRPRRVLSRQDIGLFSVSRNKIWPKEVANPLWARFDYVL